MTDFISLVNGDEINPESRASRKIPVIGFAQAGRAGFFDEDGYPAGGNWDEIDFPDKQKAAAHAYALKVAGSSMEPLYRAGDLLIVSPSATLRKGDRVIVKTKNSEVMAKELLKQSSAKVELKSLNPAYESLSLPQSEIGWIARIIWVSQ